MDFWGNLFGNSDRSYVQSWFNNQKKKITRKNFLDNDSIFVGIMANVSYFMTKQIEKALFPHKRLDSYAYDAVLFEFGSYYLAAINQWMETNHDEKREDFVKNLVTRYEILMAEALKMPIENLRAILIHRMSFYDDSFNNCRDPREYICMVTFFITYAVEHKALAENESSLEDFGLSLNQELILISLHINSWSSSCFEVLENLFKELQVRENRS